MWSDVRGLGHTQAQPGGLLHQEVLASNAALHPLRRLISALGMTSHMSRLPCNVLGRSIACYCQDALDTLTALLVENSARLHVKLRRSSGPPWALGPERRAQCPEREHH